MGPELGVSVLSSIWVKVWVLVRVVPSFLSLLFAVDDLVADHYQLITLVVKDVVYCQRFYQGTHSLILLGLCLFRAVSFPTPTGLFRSAWVANISGLILVEAQVGASVLLILSSFASFVIDSTLRVEA